MRRRLAILVHGAVQGVGFRPFVYNLALDLGLGGQVENNRQGVLIQVEGEEDILSLFVHRLQKDKPAPAIISQLEVTWQKAQGEQAFSIQKSGEEGPQLALILPDLATCPACLQEVLDPANRRYQYPFTNCTHCGPRYSIIKALPYDRPRTSMAGFALCPACQAEYDDPKDRRFHAQPNACPLCGPQVSYLNSPQVKSLQGQDALAKAVALLEQEGILALQGIGGFHLLCDATSSAAVARLRQRKHREEKPLAVMLGNLEEVHQHCLVSPQEEQLLTSLAAPIVLLRKKTTCNLAPEVAPDNPYLGVMLAYSPLHHLLLHHFEGPLVATSGNLSSEPICTKAEDALERLAGIADGFLTHNRPILRPVDDSVARIIDGKEQILRRARGYAPLPLPLPFSLPPTLAVGGQLKSSIGLAQGKLAFISQHLGDLENLESVQAYSHCRDDLELLLDINPEQVALDLHPEYLSTQMAERLSLPKVLVQHHQAHALSCWAENGLSEEALAVCWDGTGLGTDHSIWGGEFLQVGPKGWSRRGHLRSFALPGGDQAIKNPERSALGLLLELGGEDLAWQHPHRQLPKLEWQMLIKMVQKKLNSPRTTSAGRLFDVVASLIGLKQVISFEGQAAMELEFLIPPGPSSGEHYPFTTGVQVDWGPMLLAILADQAAGQPKELISQKFHNTMVEIIVKMAKFCEKRAVLLTGGCFVNRILTERACQRLREEGFSPYLHQRLPPGDGGLALGQLVACHRPHQD